MSAEMKAYVVPSTLSDNSIAYAVRFDLGQSTSVTLDCVTQEGAEKLAALMNEEVCDADVAL